MSAPIRIALVGDRDDTITAHRALPIALDLAARDGARPLAFEWIGTETLGSAARLAGFDAVWCVPGSPYRDMDGALRAIRHAREQGLPFLGTCGGFQHAVIEVARHVLGWSDAEHAETAPQAPRAVIRLLECGLVEARETLRPIAGTRLAAAYAAPGFEEGYRCRYGLDPAFGPSLHGAAGDVSGSGSTPFQVAAVGPQGDVRALELRSHPFFVLTLFQPERAALEGRVPPLAAAFAAAAAARATAGAQ